jgi:5-methyltetrahydropteroyltriglutamate--homocysteine methyltransferase
VGGGAGVKRSTERILTTHAGSLARPERLRQLLLARDAGDAVDPQEFDRAVTEAVAMAVDHQAAAGVSVVSDGEQSKLGFAAYLSGRLNGFDGPQLPRPRTLDARKFPDYHGGSAGTTRPACTGPISWKDFSAVESDIANLRDALAQPGVSVTEAFMPSASPGTIANHHPDQYYGNRETYLTAIADVMKREYEAIVNAGFILQLDCPDLALHNTWFPDLSLEDFRRQAGLHVEALNYATRDIDPDQVRIHVCWGAGEGPHYHDPELKDIVDILLRAKPNAISIVAANGRHEHEWKVWREAKLPDGKVLIPGVIDNTTNIVEHPDVVADRIVRWAELLGRENIMAGVDCGFGTSVSTAQPAVAPSVAWAKLAALGEGADRASKILWATTRAG